MELYACPLCLVHFSQGTLAGSYHDCSRNRLQPTQPQLWQFRKLAANQYPARISDGTRPAIVKVKKGTYNRRSELPDVARRRLITAFQEGVSFKRLARRFGISTEAIQKMVARISRVESSRPV